MSIIKLVSFTIFAWFMATIPLADQTFSNTVGGPGTKETRYASVRGWQVYAGYVNGRFSYCVGEKNEYGSKLRLGYDNAQWQLSVPVHSNANWNGDMEIDGKVTGLAGTVANRWTVAWLSVGELDAIKAGHQLIMNIGKASLDFSLSGTTATVLKVQECLQYRGKSRRKIAVVKNKPVPSAKSYSAYGKKSNTQPTQNNRVSNNYNVANNNNAVQTCPPFRQFVSPASNQNATVEFIYNIASGIAANVYWIDFNGNLVEMGILRPSLNLNTYVGHTFVVRDFSRNCYGGILTIRPGHNRFDIR